jgi:integrase
MHLTRASVARLQIPPGKADLIVFDEKLAGFGVRLRAGGSRSWIAQYRLGTRQRRLKLGSVDQLHHEQARRLAREALAAATLGRDPQLEKARAKAKASVTFEDVVSRYLSARSSRLKPRTLVEVTRHLKTHFKLFNRHPLADISRSDVSGHLTTLARHNGPVTADRARAALSALFSWSVRDGLADDNPVTRTNKNSYPVERSRVLTDAELAQIWHACPDTDYGTIVRLLMLIPARRTEIADMAWSEIDWTKNAWTLPAHRSKNHRSNVIPLLPKALELIEKVPVRKASEAVGAARDLLFGRGRAGFSGWAKAKIALDAAILINLRQQDADAEMFEWRLHDVRRTCSTKLHEMGVAPHIVEALLNHYDGHRSGVARAYNHAGYDTAKRDALELWAAHIVNITTPSPSANSGPSTTTLHAR